MVDDIEIPIENCKSNRSNSTDLIKVIKSREFGSANGTNVSDTIYMFKQSQEIHASDKNSITSSINMNVIPSETFCESKTNVNMRYSYVPLINNDKSLYNNIRESQCVSAVCTTFNLALMFISFSLPFSLHLVFQFRLYGCIFNISEEIIYEFNNYRIIIEHFKEFECFFIIGVTFYEIIQFLGFISTYRRFKRYLLRVFKLSIEVAKEHFLYNNKHDAIDNFRNYSKMFNTNLPSSYKITEDNLIRSYDEASYSFNDSRIDEIWNQAKCLRFKLLVIKIWLPFIIHLVISICASTFIYDRKSKVNHGVPLGHPGIITSMHWFVALQYEGVWCILGIYLLNVILWLYLCHINRHDNLFYNMDVALLVTQEVLERYACELSNKIWNEQMLLFTTTAYANTNVIVNKNSFSQINIGGNKNNKSCLCKYISTSDCDERSPRDKVAIDELKISLVDGKMKSIYRNL